MTPHIQNLDLRAPAATAAREPVSPRASSSLRAGWRRLRGLLDDSLAGDVIGIAAIILIFLSFYFATA